MSRILFAKLALASALLASVPAWAQLQPRPMLPPDAAPSQMQLAGPLAAPPGGPASTAGAAPVRTEAGGFGAVPPSPGREDPAQRMSVSGAEAAVAKLASEADRTVDGMIAPAAGSGKLALPNPAIENEGDLKELQRVQRQIQLYSSRDSLAQVVVKYWGTVYNNDNAKAWREEEHKKQDAETERLKKAALEEDQRQKLLAAQAAALGRVPSQMAPGGVAEYVPPQVFEIVNGKATLVLRSGTFAAVAGTVLPTGDRVVSVGGAGVVIVHDGKRQTLGFAQGR